MIAPFYTVWASSMSYFVLSLAERIVILSGIANSESFGFIPSESVIDSSAYILNSPSASMLMTHRQQAYSRVPDRPSYSRYYAWKYTFL